MTTKLRLLGLACGTSLLAAFVGCGQGEISSVGGMDAKAAKSWDQVLEPSRGFYDMVMAQHMSGMDKGPAIKATPTALFINFGGAMLHKGKDDGSLTCAESTMIAQSGMAPDAQQKMVETIGAWFDKAGLKIKVVTTKPTDSFYATVHIGSTWNEFGCPGEAFPARVYSDLGNLNSLDQAVVFADMIPDPYLLTTAVAHVAGHMLGAVHSKDGHDVMSYSMGNGMQGFGGQALVLDGAYRAPGTLPGMTQLSTMGNLLKDLSANQQRVDLSRVQAEINLIMPGKVDLTGLNKVMTVIKLAEAAALNQNTSPIPTGTSVGVNTAILIASMLQPQIVPVVAGVDVLAKLAGYSSTGDALVAVINMALGQAGVGAKVPPMLALPDVATILGLQSLTSIEELVRTMNAEGDYVNKSYTGEDKQAMLSLLKIGYAQAYNQLFRSTLTE